MESGLAASVDKSNMKLLGNFSYALRLMPFSLFDCLDTLSLREDTHHNRVFFGETVFADVTSLRPCNIRENDIQ